MTPPVLKRTVEAALVAMGVPRIMAGRRRDRALVLAYHNVVPDGATAGDRSLHLPVSRFAAHLAALIERYAIVPLAAALAPATGSPRPRVAITFDDAYLGAVTLGLRELARRNLPATIFVAPGRLGDTFWWDELAGADGLAPATRDHLLDAEGGDETRARAWAVASGAPRATLPREWRAATEAELAAAFAAHPALTLASHTWSHPNLTRVADSTDQELRRPLAWLRERYDRVLPYLAYPYGLASPAVHAAARAAGYEAALLVTGGWLGASPAPDRHALPRLNVPAGLSANGFKVRVATA